MLSLITGSVGKYIGYGALAVSLLGGVAVVKHEYDNSVIASVAAKQATANLAVERADNARLLASVTTLAVESDAQATTVATLKGAIANAKPSTFSCIRSDAGRIVLGSMRHNAGGH